MKKLVHFITYSKAAAYIAALLYIVVWGFRSALAGTFSLSGCLGLLLALAAGYLSVKVAREFSFCDAKNVLPATLFFMSCAVAPQLSLERGGAHLILFSIASYVLLHTYRSRSAMGRYFVAFAFVGAECLLMPSLLMVLPWLVLCCAFMDSLHARTLLASLLGLLCPFWVMGGVLFLAGRTGFVAPYLGQILPSVSSVPMVLGDSQLWMPLVWALLLAVPGSVVILLNRTMTLQANVRFRFVIVSLVVLLIAISLSPECYAALFPCVLVGASLIGAGLFVTSDDRARNIYFLALFILWLVVLGLQLWSSSTMC